MDVFTRGNIAVHVGETQWWCTVTYTDQWQYSARNANREALSHAWCFEAIFLILSIMMSLYSKQNCNNNRDGEWNNSSYIRKDSVILRWDGCYTFCVDKALLTCNIYFVSPSCISSTCSSLYIFEFRATVFEIKRWYSHIALIQGFIWMERTTNG